MASDPQPQIKTRYLRKKPRSKKHLHKPSKICEICDEKLNSVFYMLQARGCTNCGKSGCKQCVKYSRTFDNGDNASVCKNCKDLPKKISNVSYVNKTSENVKADASEGVDVIVEEDVPIVEEFYDQEEKKEVEYDVEPEGFQDKKVSFVPKNDETLLSSRIEELNDEVSRLERATQEEKKQIETAKHNERLALSRFKEISAENNKLKGELKRANLSRANSFDSSSVLLTRLDEIQMISEGRDEELIKVGKQMDDLVHQLQITETQKQKALEDLQAVQSSQIEQLEQIVGRLSTQKNRTLEIKNKLQSAIDERDHHKKLAKLKEKEINELMLENEKLRTILEDSDTSSTSTFETLPDDNQKTQTTTQSTNTPDNSPHVPVKLVIDLNSNSPSSTHVEVQTDNFSDSETASSGNEEEWEVERRKMQNAMENLRGIIRKWKDSGVVQPEVVV